MKRIWLGIGLLAVVGNCWAEEWELFDFSRYNSYFDKSSIQSMNDARRVWVKAQTMNGYEKTLLEVSCIRKDYLVVATYEYSHTDDLITSKIPAEVEKKYIPIIEKRNDGYPTLEFKLFTRICE